MASVHKEITATYKDSFIKSASIFHYCFNTIVIYFDVK